MPQVRTLHLLLPVCGIRATLVGREKRIHPIVTPRGPQSGLLGAGPQQPASGHRSRVAIQMEFESRPNGANPPLCNGMPHGLGSAFLVLNHVDLLAKNERSSPILLEDVLPSPIGILHQAMERAIEPAQKINQNASRSGLRPTCARRQVPERPSGRGVQRSFHLWQRGHIESHTEEKGAHISPLGQGRGQSPSHLLPIHQKVVDPFDPHAASEAWQRLHHIGHQVHGKRGQEGKRKGLRARERDEHAEVKIALKRHPGAPPRAMKPRPRSCNRGHHGREVPPLTGQGQQGIELGFGRDPAEDQRPARKRVAKRCRGCVRPISKETGTKQRLTLCWRSRLERPNLKGVQKDGRPRRIICKQMRCHGPWGSRWVQPERLHRRLMPSLSTKITRILVRLMTLAATAMSQSPEPLAGQIPFSEVMARAAQAPPPAARVPYGPEPAQFGALWLPERSASGPDAPPGGLPVVMLIHGGCWLNSYGVDHVPPMAAALRDAGMAVWAPEYRRIGDPGGGNPGTFEDVRASWEALQTLAPAHGLDLGRVILMGHSAGGHLALWLAQEPGVTPRGVVLLAGITDLEAYRSPTGCGASVDLLMGGTPDEVPDSFADFSPVHRSRPAPAVPVVLVVADGDAIVPGAQAQAYMARDPRARVVGVPGGHFDLIAPWAPPWPSILNEVDTLVRSP